MKTYPTKADSELIGAISNLNGEKEVGAFIRDLLTPAEITEFSGRFQIAKLLWTTNLSYVDISKKVGASTTTVTRVAQWLYKESWQGYAKVLSKLYGDSKR
jgi:TrpR-related protein YerC/YecD